MVLSHASGYCRLLWRVACATKNKKKIAKNQIVLWIQKFQNNPKNTRNPTTTGNKKKTRGMKLSQIAGDYLLTGPGHVS